MKYPISIIALFLSLVSFSQTKTKDSTASCIAYWTKGETKLLNITRNKISYEQGKVKSNTNFSYLANVLVVDSTSSGYTMQWDFHLPDSIKLIDSSLANSLPVYEGMKMVYKITETGLFVELVNWQEVRDTYIRMMEVSLPKNMDSSTRAALDQSKALFNSKEMVEASLIKEIQLYHLPYGYEFTTKEAKATTELPNPFSSEPLPAFQSFKITELKPKQDYFKLVITQTIDKAGAQKLFEGIFKKMNIDDAKAVSEAKKILATFEITDYSEYKITQSTGWIKQVSHSRIAKSDEFNQRDSFIIQMKD